MLDISEHDPKSLILAAGDMARSAPPMTSAFVSEISRQLLGKGSGLALALTWIEQRLNEDGRTISELVSAEIQKQAVNQVSVSNSIGSLRLLSSLDWRDFVEEHSIVEQTLRKDPDQRHLGHGDLVRSHQLRRHRQRVAELGRHGGRWTGDLTSNPDNWVQSNSIPASVEYVSGVACGQPSSGDAADCVITAESASGSGSGQLLTGSLSGGSWAWNYAVTPSGSTVQYYLGIACENPPSAGASTCAAVGANGSRPRSSWPRPPAPAVRGRSVPRRR